MGKTQKWGKATQMVHAGQNRSAFGETSEALYLTQGYVYDNAEDAQARFAGEDEGFIYSRYANPTVKMFEDRLAALEGAEICKATATGMAAVTASLACQLKQGDHLVAGRALFGACRWVIETLLPRWGIEVTLVDGKDLDAWQKAMRPNTKSCFLETPSNPTLELADIAGVGACAKQVGALTIVDNVFATPINQSPLDLGADIVVYSATKHIDGQGRCLGGAILCDQDFADEHLTEFLRQTGPSISPYNAWTMLKGLETLSLRVARQSYNAEKLADFLSEHSAIEQVMYPTHKDHPQAELARRQMKNGSTMVAFRVKGDQADAFRFLNRLELIKLSNNLGDAKSLITHPATTTHRNLDDGAKEEQGISANLVRLSVGIEDVEDLIDDLDRALS